MKIEPNLFLSLDVVPGKRRSQNSSWRKNVNEERVVIGGWDITRIRSAEIPQLHRQLGVIFKTTNSFPSSPRKRDIHLEVAGINT